MSLLQITSILLATWCLTACSTLKKPFLFKATKADRAVFVFGTMHAGVPGWDLPSVVKDELAKSHRLYLEQDLSNMLLQTSDGNTIFISEGERRLDEWLTQEEFTAFSNSILKVRPDQLRFLKPRIAKALLLEARGGVFVSQYEARAMDFKNGLDVTLAKLADKRGTPIEALDTQLYTLCEKEFEEADIRSIQRLLRGMSAEDELRAIREMIEVYRSGEEERFIRDFEIAGDKCLLVERNYSWANLLEKNVAAGDRVFVGVGLSHLFDFRSGPGLLTLLKKNGYTVERVINSSD